MTVIGVALASTLSVTSTLEELQIPYVVGGSIASSVLGIPRMTNDADVVAAMREEHAEPFASRLERHFYVDRDMIRDAIRTRREFNVIDDRTVFKVDVFVPPLDLATRRELARGRRVVVAHNPERAFVVASAEDVIVQKLRWYRLGGEVATRQYQDALGVLRTRGQLLDRPYMREMAGLLDVESLLDRLLMEQ